MIKTYIFLPDNLMAILYEEQNLIQQMLEFPFKVPFPMFRTNKKFKNLIVYPPIEDDGYIIRPCSESHYQNENPDTKLIAPPISNGFILGNAKSESSKVISLFSKLKDKSKKKVFTKLQCKSFYYAKIDLREELESKLFSWILIEKKWSKL